MDSLFNSSIMVSSALHIYLLIYIQIRRTQLRSGRWWLTLLLTVALCSNLILLIPPETLQLSNFSRGFILSALVISLLTVYGGIMLRDVRRKQNSLSARFWLLLGIVWLGAFAIAGGLSDNLAVGNGNWMVEAFNRPNAPAWILLGGLGVSAILLLGLVFYGFYSAQLPEIANRALYWVIVTVAILVGCLLIVSGTTTLVLMGSVTLLVGCIGSVYANLSYRLFDIRSGLNLSLHTVLMVSLTTVIVFVALYISNHLNIPNTFEGNLLLGAIALAAGILYLPVRKLTEVIINPILNGTGADASRITGQYSQQVSKAVELDVLTTIVRGSLQSAMGTRRSGMLLVKAAEDGKVELEAAPGSFTDAKDRQGIFYIKSPVYQELATRQAPLSQFDIEYSSRYKEMPEVERNFLRNLQTSAYAPIIVDEVLIGILACGAKISDAPFYPRDLELLATLANQTGVALRNARLVSDLRHLNNDMSKLNTELGAANQQMGKLDAVKTDFVTIASHELRTPLAQIRGYIDIVDALNQQGALDKDQTIGLVDNLRRATERMDELIAAMLDVSQIDVNTMDLHFTQTTIESVMRMAIEPLTEAIKQRKLSLSARGLKGLPAIEADLQRLVQAFRNVVVNAIKFTPDGGKIDVIAYEYPTDTGVETPSLLVTITDTGVGISADNLELIFQKFYRGYDPGLHSSGNYKFMGAGPGLGLTIARGVIEGHGGRIWAESPGFNKENCPGSTFFVLLPLKPPDATVRRVTVEGNKVGENSRK